LAGDSLKKYLENSRDSSIIQLNLILQKKIKDHYLFHSHQGQIFILSNKDISKLISRNSFNNQRAVLLDSKVNFSNENFKTYNSDIDGYISHSKGMKISIDKKTKAINFSQSNPYDWALLFQAHLQDWKLSFKGISDINYKNLPQRFNEFGLTGCLNIYKSYLNNIDINLVDSNCEDGVNIIHSIGNVKNVNISNAQSDALDIDFSELSVNRILIENAKNDCVDLSLGNYVFNDINISHCHDKGISIGEKSYFLGKKILINNSVIGISSKDSSISDVNTSVMRDVDICIEAKNKKQEFLGSIINITELDCKGRFIEDNKSKINIKH